ncbi:hypothetical protein SS50377_21859 [Spironucleus salmonicida]|uniref:Uncharacterized protein n=1 Tax=Spironucleus salmonicida TaxID=348837 RepID=V6LJ77_9EUKA|nr:hypothetical protein SS50377_21859 [Spironucleus salmonicida]|eukprot:EST44403.1 Hypothetical protein SS50377_15706 [Spironucleus salmonicida]
MSIYKTHFKQAQDVTNLNHQVFDKRHQLKEQNDLLSLRLSEVLQSTSIIAPMDEEEQVTEPKQLRPDGPKRSVKEIQTEILNINKEMKAKQFKYELEFFGKDQKDQLESQIQDIEKAAERSEKMQQSISQSGIYFEDRNIRFLDLEHSMRLDDIKLRVVKEHQQKEQHVEQTNAEILRQQQAVNNVNFDFQKEIQKLRSTQSTNQQSNKNVDSLDKSFDLEQQISQLSQFQDEKVSKQFNIIQEKQQMINQEINDKIVDENNKKVTQMSSKKSSPKSNELVTSKDKLNIPHSDQPIPEQLRITPEEAVDRSLNKASRKLQTPKKIIQEIQQTTDIEQKTQWNQNLRQNHQDEIQEINCHTENTNEQQMLTILQELKQQEQEFQHSNSIDSRIPTHTTIIQPNKMVIEDEIINNVETQQLFMELNIIEPPKSPSQKIYTHPKLNSPKASICSPLIDCNSEDLQFLPSHKLRSDFVEQGEENQQQNNISNEFLNDETTSGQQAENTDLIYEGECIVDSDFDQQNQQLYNQAIEQNKDQLFMNNYQQTGHHSSNTPVQQIIAKLQEENFSFDNSPVAQSPIKQTQKHSKQQQRVSYPIIQQNKFKETEFQVIDTYEKLENPNNIMPISIPLHPTQNIQQNTDAIQQQELKHILQNYIKQELREETEQQILIKVSSPRSKFAANMYSSGCQQLNQTKNDSETSSLFEETVLKQPISPISNEIEKEIETQVCTVIKNENLQNAVHIATNFAKSINYEVIQEFAKSEAKGIQKRIENEIQIANLQIPRAPKTEPSSQIYSQLAKKQQSIHTIHIDEISNESSQSTFNFEIQEIQKSTRIEMESQDEYNISKIEKVKKSISEVTDNYNVQQQQTISRKSVITNENDAPIQTMQANSQISYADIKAVEIQTKLNIPKAFKQSGVKEYTINNYKKHSGISDISNVQFDEPAFQSKKEQFDLEFEERIMQGENDHVMASDFSSLSAVPQQRKQRIMSPTQQNVQAITKFKKVNQNAFAPIKQECELGLEDGTQAQMDESTEYGMILDENSVSVGQNVYDMYVSEGVEQAEMLASQE